MFYARELATVQFNIKSKKPKGLSCENERGAPCTFQGSGLGLLVAIHGCHYLHRGQTSEAFFVLFSGILFNVKWKHGQGCIK